MKTPKIYASWSKSTNVLNCIVFLNSTTPDVDVEVEYSSILVSQGDSEHRFVLTDVRLQPNSCRGLKLVSGKELHFSLKGQLMTKDVPDNTSAASLTLFSSQNATVDAIERLQNKWHCSTCRQKLLHDWCIFNRVLPLPSENWSDFADMWFCHNHNDHKQGKDKQTNESSLQSDKSGQHCSNINGEKPNDLSSPNSNSDEAKTCDSRVRPGFESCMSGSDTSMTSCTDSHNSQQQQGEPVTVQQEPETKESKPQVCSDHEQQQQQRKQPTGQGSCEDLKNTSAKNTSNPTLKTLQSKGLLSLLLSRIKECFVGETYVLVARRYVKEANVKVTKAGDAVMCRRCGRQLGVAMATDTEDSTERVYKFYLHSMVIKDFSMADLTQSDDLGAHRVGMDDYLGRLLIEQCRTYNSYRFIIETEDSGGNRAQKSTCLLWMLDPSVTIFSSSDEYKDGEVITVAATSVIKLLFKCQLVTPDTSRPVDYVSKSLVSLWRKDDTVHSFSLPEPVFLEMVQALTDNCLQLPPSQRYLSGFHVSFLSHQTS